MYCCNNRSPTTFRESLRIHHVCITIVAARTRPDDESFWTNEQLMMTKLDVLGGNIVKNNMVGRRVLHRVLI